MKTAPAPQACEAAKLSGPRNAKTGVYILGPHDSNHLNELRRVGFEAAEGFSVDLSLLLWGENDVKNTVLGVREKGRLLSTLRFDLAANREELRPKLDCDWAHELVDFPCAVLGKAATHPDHQGRGFNALLRYHALRLALQNGVRQVVGTVIQGAPRTATMRELGYQFHAHPDGWFRFGYHSRKPVEIAILDFALEGQAALPKLEAKLNQVLDAFPWRGAGRVRHPARTSERPERTVA